MADLLFNLSDTVFIQEDVSLVDSLFLIDVYDNILASESYDHKPETYYLSVYEIITALFDAVSFGFTPKNINIYDAVSITEYLYTLDLLEADMFVDNVTVTENVTLTRVFPFNNLLRGYPFVQRTDTGVIAQEFDNGVVQQRDTWGRNRMVFTITSPPLTKAKAMEFQDFFTSYKDKTFQFENPINDVTYTLRLVEKSFSLTRSHFNTFYATLVAEEVL